MATDTIITVADRLRALYEVQRLDSDLKEIEILRGELPMEVQDLGKEVEALERKAAKLNENIAESEKNKLNLSTASINATNLIEKYTKQLDGVKNNREFDALTKEIELQNLEIQLGEKNTRKEDKIIINKKETLEAVEAKLADRKELHSKKVEELEKIILKTEKEEAKLIKKSDKAKKSIDDSLLAKYVRIKNSYKNGLALAQIEREACAGCFSTIPSQKQMEVSNYNDIITCENCGRILIDANVMD